MLLGKFTIIYLQENKDAFADCVRRGLRDKQQKALEAKYFYDEVGSLLFEEITGLEEYYLTRCEAEILDAHVKEITKFFENDADPVVVVRLSNSTKPQPVFVNT